MKINKQERCACTEPERVANALKALGHPIRLRMVQELKAVETCCCRDMCACFSHSQSTISQHLSVLKEAGIIDFEKDGNKSCFTLNHDVIKDVQMALNEMFEHTVSEAKDIL